VVNTKIIHTPKAIKPSHGETANKTPPVVATPLPPLYFLTSFKLKCEVKILYTY